MVREATHWLVSFVYTFGVQYHAFWTIGDFFSGFLNFDILHARKTSEPAPLMCNNTIHIIDIDA